ncbi:hypothetical protein PENDEC_c021G07207 [Penicillium decumbens]|uniref:Uncharacterized protein n=1 Tax=Penicillium decumbens TaxID=69771 RepID=A0A1V6P634_PENDC|nr:hypothetical protein PENDEC_c021G07207 [Penicillium decumbens]
MSSFLHKHHEQPSEQGSHESPQHGSHVDDKANKSGHHHLFSHHKEGDEKHHRPSQAEIDNAEFAAAREYDHAMKSSHGAGVGFDGGRQ